MHFFTFQAKKCLILRVFLVLSCERVYATISAVGLMLKHALARSYDVHVQGKRIKPQNTAVSRRQFFSQQASQQAFLAVVEIMKNQAKHYFHNWNTTGSQQHSCVPVVKIMFGQVFHYFHNCQNLTIFMLQDLGQVKDYCCNLT